MSKIGEKVSLNGKPCHDVACKVSLPMQRSAEQQLVPEDISHEEEKWSPTGEEGGSVGGLGIDFRPSSLQKAASNLCELSTRGQNPLKRGCRLELSSWSLESLMLKMQHFCSVFAYFYCYHFFV